MARGFGVKKNKKYGKHNIVHRLSCVVSPYSIWVCSYAIRRLLAGITRQKAKFQAQLNCNLFFGTHGHNQKILF
jgi:hypothetical protein